MSVARRLQFRVAQAASLLFPAACRKPRGLRTGACPRALARFGKFVSASCRNQQAGSLRYPARVRCAGWFALALSCAMAVPLWAEEPLAPATIVVFNRNVPDSVQLAKFYAQKRGIARDHLVGLACSKEEEISRDGLRPHDRGAVPRDLQKATLVDGARKRGRGRQVSASTIRFVALIKGMPLKIRAAENYPGDTKHGDAISCGRNEASVDSDLAFLRRVGSTHFGAANNPYFQSYRRIMETEICRCCSSAGWMRRSAATVRQMITDGIETEKNGLWGRAYVDRAHNNSAGYEMGDEWLGEVVQQLRKVGVPAVYEDTPALFPAGYPISDCALYYGWYAADMAGPFTDPAFVFVPGAIAVHIHSFSASTLRNPNGDWVGPLLTKGAAASLGNVYEPYLQLTSHLDIFNDRLLHGFTFAESAYMSMQGLSWMSVMVGDPLYRPYGSWLQIDWNREPTSRAFGLEDVSRFRGQKRGLCPRRSIAKKARASRVAREERSDDRGPRPDGGEGWK